MKKRNWLIVLVTILIMSSITLFIPVRSALIFYEKNSQDLVAYLPIKEGQTFSITFVHSIHLSDVVEKYEITNDYKIKQYEMVFEQFGIGMPSTVEGDEQLVYEGGKYYLTNLDNVFDSLKVRNGKTVSKHRLTWVDHNGNEHTVPFNDYFEPGNWYTLKVENLSLFTSWKEVKIHD